MNERRTITLSNGKRSKVMAYECGTDSQFVIKEVLIDETYSFNFKPTDIVLNIGGHIGSFDIFAFDRVKKIITYEPSNNYKRILEHLELNKVTNVEAIHKAISDHTGTTDFYIHNQGGHNSLLDTGGERVEVECEDIKEIFKRHNFTKIKCDCEGGEYIIFKEGVTIPDTVNEMWFEIHCIDINDYDDISDYIRGQGFEIEEIFNDLPKNRTYLFHCIR